MIPMICLIFPSASQSALPQNTTSKLQCLNKSIIKAIKRNCRKRSMVYLFVLIKEKISQKFPSQLLCSMVPTSEEDHALHIYVPWFAYLLWFSLLRPPPLFYNEFQRSHKRSCNRGVPLYCTNS